MKKTLIVIGLAAIFLLTGCKETIEGDKSGSLKFAYNNKTEQEICKNGVIYYETFFSLSNARGYYDTSIKFTPEGKIVTCSNSIKKNSLEINSIENSTPKVN